MYKKILVPIDPSHIEDAEPTLALAEHLKSDDGEIILLSVVEEIPTYVASQIPPELLVDAKANTNEEIKSMARKAKVDATILVKSGHAAATIKAVQREEECDLIIISSHKPTTVDYLLGSTASKVVRKAPCPVFVTR